MDIRGTRPRHLVAALPAGALAGGVALSLLFALHEPPQELLWMPLQAVGVGLYLLPLVLAVGIPSYFLLRRSSQLRYLPCAVVGAVTGAAIGWVDPAWRGLFTVGCIGVGVIAASTAYYVLLRLARAGGGWEADGRTVRR